MWGEKVLVSHDPDAVLSTFSSQFYDFEQFFLTFLNFSVLICKAGIPPTVSMSYAYSGEQDCENDTLKH